MFRTSIRKLKEFSLAYPSVVFLVFSFIVWFLLFKDFWLGQFHMIDDAVIYYEHFQYYLENISRGIFPLWEAGRDGGTPIEFFLRRIGEFNPLYLTIIFFYKVLGWPYYVSHLTFMGLYYFLGLLAFYGIAQYFFKDQRIAFVAFLLMLCSSFTTFIFSSFIILVFTPMMWFFYFLLKFFHKPQKHALAGLVFSLMILATTYIPFYFLTIFLIILLFTVCFYPESTKAFFEKLNKFVRANKIFALIVFLALMVSLLPGYLFDRETKEGLTTRGGSLILVTRHYNSPIPDFLGVPIQRGEFGGIIPHLVLDEMLFDVKQIHLSQIYVPSFIYFLFLLGCFVAVNKRLGLLLLSGFTLFLMAIYDSPIYKFLYDHIFFFKYFRNYQFFFWLGVLPLLIFLSTEHLNIFLSPKTVTKQNKILRMATIVLIHGTVIWLLLNRLNAVKTTYAIVALSFLFFIFVNQRTKPIIFMAAVFILIFIEPVEVYTYLRQNVLPASYNYFYKIKSDYFKFLLPKGIDFVSKSQEFSMQKVPTPSFKEESIPSSYLTTRWAYLFNKDFNHELLTDYMRSPLQVYDHMKYVDDDHLDYEQIGRSLFENKNLAFVDSSEGIPEAFNPKDKTFKPSWPQMITQSSKEVTVLGYDANVLKLKTSFRKPEFLVYFDNYYPKWRVLIDGRPARLWRSQIKYKGVVVPEGEREVVFYFGTFFDYALKYFLIVVFFSMFMSIFIFWFKEDKGKIHV